MKVDVILGLQWGDEGKGKIVDVITPNYDIVARFQGGPNAGHTLKFDQKKFVLHTIPSGIFRPDTQNIIGNGVIIDPVIILNKEINLVSEYVDVKSKLLFSDKSHDHCIGVVVLAVRKPVRQCRRAARLLCLRQQIAQ